MPPDAERGTGNTKLLGMTRAANIATRNVVELKSKKGNKKLALMSAEPEMKGNTKAAERDRLKSGTVLCATAVTETGGRTPGAFVVCDAKRNRAVSHLER
jgi:hypothetical protein